jgi:hypothetical protein
MVSARVIFDHLDIYRCLFSSVLIVLGYFGPQRVGFQELATCAEQRFYGTRSYSLISPPRTGRRVMCLWLRFVRGGAGRPWWAQVAGAVGSSAVVVADIFGEHCP